VRAARRRCADFGSDGLDVVGNAQIALEVLGGKRGFVFRQSLSARSSMERIFPVRNPWPSGE
jgi:hypothetical protein